MIDFTNTLSLDLDNLFSEGCHHTAFDIGDDWHSITIKSNDKEAFLDAFAEEWRKRAERMLKKNK